MPRPLVTSDRFWSDCVDVKSDSTACWNWNRTLTPRGYGRFKFHDIVGVYAHRAAYFLSHPGEIELIGSVHSDKQVLHRCDNGACCNPAHLYLGNHDQNMRDKAERGRAPGPKGALSKRAKLTEEQVLEIRWMKKAGATKKALGLLFNVSTSTIKDLDNGVSYREIDANNLRIPGFLRWRLHRRRSVPR